MQYLQTHGIDYLYHMTHINNLASIIENSLLSHNEAYRQGLIETDISDPNVQDIRANSVDPFYNRPLHEYVPLYFSPRNPMLYKRQEIQEDIVILGLDPRLLFEPDILFTDGNAAASGTTFYRATQMLDQLPWSSIRARNWTDIDDGRRIKCAEVLIYQRIEPSRIQMVFCSSNKHREAIITAKQGTSIIGRVNRDLYFY
jgi:hypothetical protein